MIDLTVNEAVLDAAVGQARERNFRIPTFKQMRDPSLFPASVKEELRDVGLWDLNPLNLYWMPVRSLSSHPVYMHRLLNTQIPPDYRYFPV